MRTTVSTTVQPQSFITSKAVLEGCAIILAVAGVLAIFARYISGKFQEHKDVHKGQHDLIDKRLNDVEHDHRNLKGRTDALERQDNLKEKEIAVLQTELKANRDTLKRIEDGQTKIFDLIRDQK